MPAESSVATSQPGTRPPGTPRPVSRTVRPRLTLRRVLIIQTLCALAVLAAMLLSLGIGAYPISPFRVLDLLCSPSTWSSDMADARILFDIRLPRVLLAAVVGGGLAVSGVVYQLLLRNVLADPYILGISGGASVGALVAMTTGFAAVFPGATSLAAFAGAAAVSWAVLAAAGKGRFGEGPSLLLAGVMAGAFLSAVILALVTLSGDPVRSALFWLLGYLGGATIDAVLLAIPVVAIVFALLLLRAPAMNVLALGIEQAMHLGVDARRSFILLYVMASAVTAVLVSLVGSIGFLGLIVPHLCRLLVGPDHRILLPTALFGGALLLLAADLVARTVFAPAELPVGAVTAALGAPLFLLLLRKG